MTRTGSSPQPGSWATTDAVMDAEPRFQAAVDLAPDERFHFEIYHEDQVRISSSLFCGGMWRWRLCSADGAVLALSMGYATEDTCRTALSAVHRHAGTARWPRPSH